MIKSALEYQSPMVKLFFLLVLSIGSLSVFLFFSSLVMKLLWGFDFISDPTLLENFSDPFVVDANRLMLLFQHFGLFIVPSLIFLYVSTRNPRNFILWSRQYSIKDLLMVIVILIAIMPFINLLIVWNGGLHLPDFLSGVENMMRNMEDAAALLTDAIVSMDSLSEYLYMVIIVAILPAIGEELMFRGIIQRLFAQQFHSYHAGIWISAFFFSAIHFQFFGFFPRLLLGVAFGYLLVYSGNIIYPMVGHFVNNFTSLTFAYLIQHGMIDENIDTIGANSEWLFILPGLALGAFLFYLLWKKRNIGMDLMYVERGGLL
jgi:membrane protease YdiL (CAAX protease family)